MSAWVETSPARVEVGTFVRLAEWREDRYGKVVGVRKQDDGRWCLAVSWRFTNDAVSFFLIEDDAAILERAPDPDRLRPVMPVVTPSVHQVEMRLGRYPESV